MKALMLLIFISGCFLGCTKKNSDDKQDLSQKPTQEQKDQLKIVTLGMGDMELVSEKYKKDQDLSSRSLEQSDEARLASIFQSIDDGMKNNENCQKFKKQSPGNQYNYYAGVVITGSECPLALDAETAEAHQEMIAKKEITVLKNLDYALQSAELIALIDVNKYKGDSKLKSTMTKKDGRVAIRVINQGQGSGNSQSQGAFTYDYYIQRIESRGQSIQSVSLVDSTYNFKFLDFTMTLTSSMSQTDPNPATRYYYLNDNQITRKEFSELLGTLAMPESMVSID